MTNYKIIFFDLDKTLWDTNKNAGESLADIFEHFKLYERDISFQKFEEIYHKHNNSLWDQYRQGKVSKTALRSTRFKYTLDEFNIKDRKLVESISTFFYQNTPKKNNLIPGTIELLKHLSPNYKLAIITNGFDDTQLLKLKNTGIFDYFQHVITSDTVKAPKPSEKIFNAAMSLSNVSAHESLMVGDDLEVDIKGAMNVGMHQAYFNPDRYAHNVENITHEINHLKELISIL